MNIQDAFNLGFFAGMNTSDDAYVIAKAYCKDRNIVFKDVIKLMKECDKIITEVSLRYGIVGR